MEPGPSSGDPPADEETVTWRELHREALSRLERLEVDSPAQEARWIVEVASGHEGTRYLSGLDALCTRRGVARFDRMMSRREMGEPLQYVLGRWGFRTLDLFVDRRVLIPRPETEVVAQVALDELGRHEAAVVFAIDLGTGSGAIGLSLVVEDLRSQVLLTDVSPDALAVARANLAGVGRPGARVTIAEGPWFAAVDPSLRGQVHVVVSNPPYVAADEELPAVVREWEPAGALVAGQTGLEDAEVIIGEAGGWLCDGGALVVELAPHQLQEAAALARDAGFADVEILADQLGRDRVLRARGTS